MFVLADNPPVRIAFTDRQGGTSKPPYDSLNLAARVGDDPDDVAANRALAGEAAGFDPERLVLARQVHGSDALEAQPGESGVMGEGDVLIARRAGVVIGMLTADCAPVILAGEHGIAVVHAGWRGLVAGAIEAGVEGLGSVDAAWVGPCIHACCYEVGDDVTQAFEAVGLPVAGTDRVDPAQAAAFALGRAGISNINVAPECTHCDDRFFSYRRDGTTGRQGAFAWLE